MINSKFVDLTSFLSSIRKRQNFKNTVREEIGENIDFGSISSLMEPLNLAETCYLP